MVIMMKTIEVRNMLASSAIIVMFFVAIAIFAASFLPSPIFHDVIFHAVEINRLVQQMISVILLFLTWNLFLRKKFAWMICIILLSASLFLHFVLHHHFINTFIIIFQAYVLVVLLLCYSDFKRPSDRLSIKRSIIFAVLAIIAVLTVAIVGRITFSLNAGEPLTFVQSLNTTFAILFGAYAEYNAYDWFVFALVWFCVAICIGLVLRTATFGVVTSMEEKMKTRELVLRFGQNASSYLALEGDKKLFFSKDVNGVIAYGVVGNVVTVCGDPISAPEDFVQLLAEFKAFCADCSYHCIFLGTTDVFLKEYEMLGYHHVKAGEEAIFKLDEYQLAGGKMQKMRALINHANKEVTTHEYKPHELQNLEIEKGIDAVSEAWLEGKKSGQLGFSVGGVGLDDPLDRRYFYAVDENNKIVAFNVFLPYITAEGKGYLADVTRRVPHAPGGVTEKLIFDGFMTFKDEGIEFGSMGLAPLANVHEEGIKDDVTVKLLEFIYEKCNRFYGFKDLHHAKEKYSPTIWTPGYFVYSTKNITPEIAYATIKIQNPGGIKDFLLSGVMSKLKPKEHES